MKRNDWLKFGVILAIVLISLYFLYPPGESINLGLDLQGGSQIVLEAQPLTEGEEVTKSQMEKLIVILDNRVNQYGLANSAITQIGERRVLVKLPGAEDPKQARQLIGRTALLEFRKVIEEGKPGEELIPTSIFEEVLYHHESNRPYIVERETLLTGAALTDAQVMTRSATSAQARGGLFIALTFNREGAQQFAEVINRLDVNDQIAIVLDNAIYSAPLVSESIKEAARTERSLKNAEITGQFTIDEARLLAVVLRAGALPVDVTIVQENSVGPTLGRDSIRRGVISIVTGFILIILYMFLRYRWLGLVGNFALLLNMLIIFGALAVFKATLTLPGIAGIILTIGMSIDANVIIFERIKEELHSGKSHVASLKGGFQKSLSAVLDANITTLAAAGILYLVGTGPIRGFAITLSIGILGSLFCALFVTRFVLETTGLTQRVRVKPVMGSR